MFVASISSLSFVIAVTSTATICSARRFPHMRSSRENMSVLAPFVLMKHGCHDFRDSFFSSEPIFSHTLTFFIRCPPSPSETSSSRIESFINKIRLFVETSTPSGNFFKVSPIERGVIWLLARFRSRRRDALTRKRKKARSAKSRSQLKPPDNEMKGGVLSARMQSSGIMIGFL